MSILFLTIHRTASSFLNEAMLGPLAVDLGFDHADPFLDAKRAGVHKTHVRLDSYADRDRTVLGPVRQPRSITDVALFDDWQKILLLRHPLDVLVSWYFYTGFGQSMAGVGDVGERLLASRQKAIELGIEGWCQMMAPALLRRYDDYRMRYAARPNMLLLRYEDMVADWSSFCDRISAFVDPGMTGGWRSEMDGLVGEFTVAGEAPQQHKRQVAPGDHVRKLSPETARDLTAAFADVIAWINETEVQKPMVACLQ